MSLALRNQQGDTIVEVLIAIAIVSLTLAGAYASVNRSSNATRTAQERGEALKWAETQVEQIKATTGDISDTRFCYLAENLKFQKLASGEKGCPANSPLGYAAVITQNPAKSGAFHIVVTWDALDSATGKNQVELDYSQ